MNSQLFIPDKIKVGFQKRTDCYTKQLGYIIYYDQKGVLRKEKSWDGWRDKKIEPVDCDNAPHSGFVLNKDVKRTTEWFGSGRNMIRVWDSRGFEFEITTGNLLFILMTTDCSRRGLVGDFVYAWWGTEPILLPVGCEEYQNCVKYTGLQSCKIGAKDMVAGCFYETKKQEQLYYLGKLPWFTTKWRSEIRTEKKEHVFLNSENKLEILKLDKLARKITTEPDSNLGASMDIYSKSIHSKVVGGALKRQKLDFSRAKHNYYGYSREYWMRDADIFKRYVISETRTSYGAPEKPDAEKVYHRSYIGGYSLVDSELKLVDKPVRKYYYASDNNDPEFTQAQLNEMEFGEFVVTLENGSKHAVNTIFSI